MVPLLVPFALGPLARRCLDRLTPVTALWSVTLALVVLAGASVAALGAFVLTGLLKVPLLAGLGDLVHPLRTASDLVVLPAAAAATGVLTVGAWTVVRSTFAAGPSASYDATRVLVGLLVAAILFALASYLVRTTDWRKPTEADTPALDEAIL